MAAHINDPDVLIRSVATRGHLGGWRRRCCRDPAACGVVDDLIVLETVRLRTVGDRDRRDRGPTVVIFNPGAGDAVQAAKAGLLEVADIVVVNKADRDGADQTVRDLRAETKAPILKLVAAKAKAYRSWSRRSTNFTAPIHLSAAPRAPVRRSCRWRRRSAQPSRSRTPGRGGRGGSMRSLHRGGTTLRHSRRSAANRKGQRCQQVKVLAIIGVGGMALPWPGEWARGVSSFSAM